MNKKTQIIYVLLSVLTVLLLAVVLRWEALTVPTENPAAEYLYELRLFNGRIALFYGGADAPLHVFERDLSTLPPADRAALTQGIRIRDVEELRKRLEDFF